MHTLLLAVLMFPLLASGEQVSISYAQGSGKAVAAIKSIGGVDITSEVGWKYTAPRKATFWELKDYDTVVVLIEEREKVSGLSYWARKDFTPKDRRVETEQEVKTLTADTKTKKISIEKAK